MYKTVKTQTNLPVKICHLKVINIIAQTDSYYYEL